jgi:hypothetical protein
MSTWRIGHFVGEKSEVRMTPNRQSSLARNVRCMETNKIKNQVIYLRKMKFGRICKYSSQILISEETVVWRREYSLQLWKSKTSGRSAVELGLDKFKKRNCVVEYSTCVEVHMPYPCLVGYSGVCQKNR